MATTVLHLTRDQIAAIARGDQEAIRQVEALIRYERFSGFGQAVIDDDIVLDTTGTTLSVDLPIGRYFIDLVVMFAVVGGGGGDGVFIEGAGTAAISAGYLAAVLGDGAGTIMTAASTSGAFGFSGADGVLMVRGFLDVQQAGVFGFNVKVQGVPTSVTLLAGSGLTTTMQKEAV